MSRPALLALVLLGCPAGSPDYPDYTPTDRPPDRDPGRTDCEVVERDGDLTVNEEWVEFCGHL